MVYINFAALMCQRGSNRCTVHRRCIPQVIGDSLLIEPPYDGGGGVLAAYKPPTCGYG